MLAAQLLSVKFRQSPCGPPEISPPVITYRTQTHPTSKAVNTPVIQQLWTAKGMRPWSVDSHCFKSSFFFSVTFRKLWQNPHSYYMCKAYTYISMYWGQYFEILTVSSMCIYQVMCFFSYQRTFTFESDLWWQ